MALKTFLKHTAHIKLFSTNEHLASAVLAISAFLPVLPSRERQNLIRIGL